MTEIKGNNDSYCYYTPQFSKVKKPSELSAVRGNLLKPVELHCYLLQQTTVVQHPTQVHGIQCENLNFEFLRLATFSNYPTSSAKSVLILARYGFVYIGNGSDDKVMCYSCRVTKNNWLPSEDVYEVHKMVSIDCSMVTGRESNNIPVKAGSQTFKDIFIILASCDEGYCSLETDAAPLACQENIHSQFDAREDRSNFDPVKGPTVKPIGSIQSESKSIFYKGNTKTPGNPYPSQFATLETATITVPSTAIRPQPLAAVPKTISQHSSSPTHTNDQVSSDTSSSNKRNAITTSGNFPTIPTPNNSTANSVRASPNQFAYNQSTNPEPPKSHSFKSKDGKGPTYSELGIVTERAKRKEYALKIERLKTFSNWSRSHHIKSDDLADAGFYFAGYGDCARCFFCGGGLLRNWEDEDDVWVEHARWFPKCAFIRQLMGKNFVDAVQELNKTTDKINFTMVTNKMGTFASAFLLDCKTNPLKRDPAVIAMIEFGYNEETVLEIASVLKSQDGQLSADVLLSMLKENGKGGKQTSKTITVKSSATTAAEDMELIRQVKERNSIMRQQTMCKICMDKDVEVVFLPCGHLVSCAECASAFDDCPVCRKQVKGTVRAFIGRL